MAASAHRDKAVSLLVNYFEAIARRAGMNWDADYTAEIGEAVEAIVAAAFADIVMDEHRGMDTRLRELTRRLDKHEQQLEAAGL